MKFISTVFLIIILGMGCTSAYAETQINEIEYRNAVKQLNLFYVGKLDENTTDMKENYREVIPTGTGESLIFTRYGDHVYLSQISQLVLEHKFFMQKDKGYFRALLEYTLYSVAIGVCSALFFCCLSINSWKKNNEDCCLYCFAVFSICIVLSLSCCLFMFQELLAKDLNRQVLPYVTKATYNREQVPDLLQYLGTTAANKCS